MANKCKERMLIVTGIKEMEPNHNEMLIASHSLRGGVPKINQKANPERVLEKL